MQTDHTLDLLSKIGGFVFNVLNFGVTTLAILFVTIIIWFTVARKYALAKKGFFIEVDLGREPGDGVRIAYEEKDKSLIFYGPASRTIKVPSEQLWNEIMPDWAKNRKDEILERIKQDVRKLKFTFRESGDKRNVTSILASDQNIEGDNKVFYVIKGR